MKPIHEEAEESEQAIREYNKKRTGLPKLHKFYSNFKNIRNLSQHETAPKKS